MKLRYYQKECINAIYDYYKKGVTSQLIVQCTGSGKRLQSCEVAKHFNRTLFIAHREELIEQAFNELEALFPLQCGIIKAERFEIDKKIVVASAQTLYRRLDKMNPDMFDLVIIDECHHYASQQFIKPLRYFKPKLMTGYSATPTRLDGLSLSNLFEEIAYEYPLHKAIEDRYLCSLDGIRIQTEIDMSKIHRLAGDFNQRELSELVDIDARNQLVIQKYQELCNGKKAVGFAIDIEHAERLCGRARANGIAATFVHSEMNKEQRKNNIESFTLGSVNLIFSIGILTEGWDFYDVGALLMARPTMSEALFVQMAGRGTRLKSKAFIEHSIVAAGKEDQYMDLIMKVKLSDLVYQKHGVDFFIDYGTRELLPEENAFMDFIWQFQEAKILDFVDNVGKHSLINTFSLDRGKPIKERVFVSQEKKQKLFEEQKRKEIKVLGSHKHDKKVNLLELPKVEFSNGRWRMDPATDKQINYLKSLGIWQEGVEYTKLQANQFISSFKASEAQIRLIQKYGYNVGNGCSLGEAQLAIAEIKERMGWKEKEPKAPIKI